MSRVGHLSGTSAPGIRRIRRCGRQHQLRRRNNLQSEYAQRLALVDGSFLDIWLSADGDYSYHWERRRQAGTMYRWDNAPHYPSLTTFPAHFHNGDEMTVLESHLHSEPERALHDILAFARQLLSG